MSPLLSRPYFFLEALNDGRAAVRAGSPAHRLRTLLLELAEAVREGRPASPELVGRLNEAFGTYDAIRLKLVAAAPEQRRYGERRSRQQAPGSSSPPQLQAVFADAADDPARVYMEGIISLLEAMERGRLELQTCMQCGNWYVPYQRAQVTKFCGSKCRNRYHYANRTGSPGQEATS